MNKEKRVFDLPIQSQSLRLKAVFEMILLTLYLTDVKI
ncbi:hypothetical protein GXM_06473 [Nostoc sphaeroides CCNUC1]|uniref:Uncharacterized protein n=1 Tax=Nostoc sphaeroides CCNUC1 TaxID=2653204 RepID=A0A5P8WAP7_9NOSO|nr:hypothetical protein GXM_06473 [Nostoc sphaeroides CCNUC1]